MIRLLSFSLLLLTFLNQHALAWDATAHRLGGYLVHQQLNPARRAQLDQLLLQHPRYQQDFLAAMPDWVQSASVEEQQRWRFGQAAAWPDAVRSLRGTQADTFNRPDWHWLEGHWMPAAAELSAQTAPLQGNIYLNLAPFPNLYSTADTQSRPGNIMEALDYMQTRLQDLTLPPADRAVALCWVLHLGADLHQPLHAGALYSAERFPAGDRGGNLISTDQGNLHAVWDQALRGQPFNQQLEALSSLTTLLQSDPASSAGNTADWLMESRQLLQEEVYPEALRQQIAAYESADSLPVFTLTGEYREGMRSTAARRLALSAIRLSARLQQ